MNQEADAWAIDDREPQTPPIQRLKVLIVGDAKTLGHSQQLLLSLATIGYGIAVLGAVTDPSFEATELHGSSCDPTLLEKVQKRVAEDPPDVLILTTDNEELFRCLVPLLPPQTRILDSFVLRIVKGLKEVSGELAATRSRLETVELIKEVLMSGPEISLMVVDEDLNILEINNAILDRTKMSQEDCIARPCHWVLRKEMKPCYQRGEHCAVREVIRTGKSVHTMREDHRSSEKANYFTVSAYPLKRDERGKKNVLIIWKDITRGMTHVLNRQARTIRESFFHTLKQDKMVAMGKLAAAAVHEINNPIQGILTFAKLMRQSFDKESLSPEEVAKFKSYLDLIATESARCGMILRNLLSFARLGNLEKTAVDLNPVLDDLVMLANNRMELQGITLVRDIADNLLPIYGDRSQIKQALLNLIINAVDAMPNGGVINLSAEMDKDRNHVRIRISDAGTGIPKHLQSSIWEPFVTTKDTGKGVGLGLSVVYGIVTQHGGSVDMQSEENRGAVFTVSLPVFDRSREHSDP